MLEHVEEMHVLVDENPHTSQRRLAARRITSRGSVCCSPKKLKMKPYCLQRMHELLLTDPAKHITFCCWMTMFVWDCGIVVLDHVFFSDKA